MRRNKVIHILLLRKDCFKNFDQVYLFGSSLNDEVPSNDVDLLLVYTKNLRMITTDVRSISCELENALHSPIDITALSQAELNETRFLARLHQKLYRIK